MSKYKGKFKKGDKVTSSDFGMEGIIQKILPHENCIVLWNGCVKTKEWFGELRLIN